MTTSSTDQYRLLGVNAGQPPVTEAVGTWDDITHDIEGVASRTASFLVVGPGVITHHDLSGELDRAILDPGLRGIRWLALAGDGWDLDGRHWDSGNYLDDPADPAPRPLRAAAHAEPALLLVDSEMYRATGIASDGTSHQAWMQAMLTAGPPVFLTHHIRFSAHDRTSGTPPPPVGDRTADWLRTVRPDPTLTIVVRTAGDRPALYRRAMRAAVRAGPAAVVVVSPPGSDVDPSGLAHQEHTRVEVRSVPVAPTDLPGRTAAVMAGIHAADTDYVWFVDDDDWAEATAVEAIARSVHAHDRPVIVGTVTAHEEQWIEGECTASSPIRTYVADEWYRAFTGWNHLPNCALVYPVELLRKRLATTAVRHDLGEDYALQILAVTSPGATVLPIADPIANVSVRDHGTTVSMPDRTPWLRDLGSHVSDLVDDDRAGAAPLWRLGRTVRDVPYPAPVDLRADASGDVAPATPEASRRRRRWSRH